MKPTQPTRGLHEVALCMLVLASLFVAPASASAANPELLWRAPADSKSGSGAGQLDHPKGVAADPSSGHVFVAGGLNNRVDEYDSYGQFLEAWGWGVADGSAELQACGPAGGRHAGGRRARDRARHGRT